MIDPDLRTAYGLPDPDDEVDADGRHVHPYVRQAHVDPTAGRLDRPDDEDHTPEHRSCESRVAFHGLEQLLGGRR